MQHRTIPVATSYLELCIEELANIQVGLTRGMSVRTIARMINRSPSELCNSPAYSQLRFVTPEQHHSGDDAVLCSKRLSMKNRDNYLEKKRG